MMKNKIYFKNYLLKTLIIIIIFTTIFITLNILEYKKYEKNFNIKINNMINILISKYDKVTKDELIEIINNKISSTNILEEYGIDLYKDSLILENKQIQKNYLILKTLTLITLSLLLLLIYIKYNQRKDKEINKITNYIEEINRKNYKLEIDSISEDELSILKNEIYKTTVMLKEVSENAIKDKLNLKVSLDDISHQFKTPLTSILIMIDNIIDDKDMEDTTRDKFIRNIKREITNINFLVNSLLKLSKFDANTISYRKEEVSLKSIIEESIKNVKAICDLKNIQIHTHIIKESTIKCDKKWQTESLTNIIKNSIEHSKEQSKVDIEINKNNLYSTVKIINYENEIDKKDLKNIFERFYKGKNSHEESIGIGLALSKKIIEKDNGRIEVKSDKKETVFEIKYFT